MFIVFWRTTILFFLVIVVLRFMGKRQIGELQPSELVTTIMISNIAAIPIENIDTPLAAGVIPIAVLACYEVLSSALTLKSRKLRGLVVGKSRTIIHDGTIDQRELRNLRWSIDDLMEQLRGAGTFDIEEVAFAVAETNGNLSVYPKFSARPVVNEDLGLPTPGCDSPPAIVINDGQVVEVALRYLNLSPEWLEKVLREEGHAVRDIFLMSSDRTAKYKIVLKEGIK